MCNLFHHHHLLLILFFLLFYSYEAKLTVFGAEEFVAAVHSSREGREGHNNGENSNGAADGDTDTCNYGDIIGSPVRSNGNKKHVSSSGGPWASPKATGYDTPPCSPPPVLSPLARPRSGGPTSASSHAAPLLPGASGGGGFASSTFSSSSSTAAVFASKSLHWLDLVWPPHLAALSNRSVASLCALAVPRLHECHRAALRLCRGLYPHPSAAAPVDSFSGSSRHGSDSPNNHYGGSTYGDVSAGSNGGANELSEEAEPPRSTRRKSTPHATSSAESSTDSNPNNSTSPSAHLGGSPTMSVPWRDRNWWLPPASATSPQKPLACVRKFERPKPHVEAATIAPLGPRRLRNRMATLLARERSSSDATASCFATSTSNSHGIHHNTSLSKPSGCNHHDGAAAVEVDEYRRNGWPDETSGFSRAEKRTGPAQLSPQEQKLRRRSSD